eukprot:CAMPEP_0181409184 /NCGR_PEP_ID=MMETSP1110-20121109/6685_1 /TAXON_ID=174948 /ORGANISM="Symbiodinium sp., Strain CCMP421" /LENGTH=172 /DNA_ID=CAMNT_0023531677 /DNA_START=216 /DNA_END=735 /DNA_ORIENTATION=-
MVRRRQMLRRNFHISSGVKNSLASVEKKNERTKNGMLTITSKDESIETITLMKSSGSQLTRYLPASSSIMQISRKEKPVAARTSRDPVGNHNVQIKAFVTHPISQPGAKDAKSIEPPGIFGSLVARAQEETTAAPIVNIKMPTIWKCMVTAEWARVMPQKMPDNKVVVAISI